MSPRLWILQALPLFALGVTADTALCEGKWGLSNFAIKCIDKNSPGVCHYSFNIREGLDPFNAGFVGDTACSFDVADQGDLPASQVNLTDVACKNATHYRVNLGWDSNQFATVCVTNKIEHVWAFFSYDDYMIVNNVSNTTNVQQAYQAGTFNCAGNNKTATRPPRMKYVFAKDTSKQYPEVTKEQKLAVARGVHV